jgi:hypothetical protein
MGAHLIDGRFQSDKYPACPAGKVPLSTKDPMAQDLLFEYAQRRRSVDAEFSDDLEAALRADGYDGPPQDVDYLIEALRSNPNPATIAQARLVLARFATGRDALGGMRPR